MSILMERRAPTKDGEDGKQREQKGKERIGEGGGGGGYLEQTSLPGDVTDA